MEEAGRNIKLRTFEIGAFQTLPQHLPRGGGDFLRVEFDPGERNREVEKVAGVRFGQNLQFFGNFDAEFEHRPQRDVAQTVVVKEQRRPAAADSATTP